jgi:hypothetical protein
MEGNSKAMTREEKIAELKRREEVIRVYSKMPDGGDK